MLLQKVRSTPAAELNNAVSEVQETALRNTQLDCKMNEAQAHQEHVRRVNLVATQRFHNAIPL